MEDDGPAKQQLKALTKKYKLFYPEEVLFDGETIEWVHKLTTRQLLFQKIRWIVLLSVICLITLLVLEPFILHFARSFTTVMGPIAFIPLFPLLIVPFFVLFTTDMVDIVTNYRVLEVEVSRRGVVTRYLPFCSISGVKKYKSSVIFSHNIVETFRAAPPSPPPYKNLKIQSFQYELPDPFVDFLRKNKDLRNDESRWIYMPKRFEMWKHSILGMIFFCVVAMWLLCVLLLHFTIHMPHLRQRFGTLPVISVVTWAYYNFLLGRTTCAVVLTEKNMLTMGYGLWFMFSNSYHNGLNFLVSTPIDKSMGILKVEMNLKDKSGLLWASCSTAPFGMLGPNVMTRAEMIFRKQFELAALLSTASSPFFPSAPSPPTRGSSSRRNTAKSSETFIPLPPTSPPTPSSSSASTSFSSDISLTTSHLASTTPPSSPPLSSPPSLLPPEELPTTGAAVLI